MGTNVWMVDWNWREFGRGERFALAGTGAGMVAGLWGAVAWNAWVVWFGLYVAGQAFNIFAKANLKRRGLYQSPNYDYEPRPGRPVRVGALQAILGGGFVIMAGLLGLLIWVNR